MDKWDDHIQQTTIVRGKRFSVELRLTGLQLGDSLCQADRPFHFVERRQGYQEFRQRYKFLVNFIKRITWK